jgi:iron complex outermembrane receptor protein
MRLNRLALCLLTVGLGAHVAAQTQAPASNEVKASTLEKVVVTGSRIKRLADEKALPIQTINRDEIDRLGLQTAEDLLNVLAANSANADNATSRNNVFGAEQDRLTGGGSFANLRGLGPTGTLVLLNGRRVSTHGTSGGAVDLNAIPMDAVERVEVLKDGASAIYGTDAIGGVINYILKKNFQGAQLRANYGTPLADGGGQTSRASVTVGVGSLDTNKFNVMASLTVDSNKILRGIDREWASGYQPSRFLSPDTTSAPHANIIAAAGTALTSAGTVVGSTDPTRYTNLNLLAIRGQCQDVPFGVPLADNITLWDKFGYTNANSRYRCATDYGRQFMLTPPKEAWNLMGRATIALDADTTFAVEVVNSRTEIQSEFTPYQFSSTSNAVTNYPVGGPHYLDMRQLVGATQFDPTRPIAYRLRMWDWGYRTIKNTSDNLRASASLEGTIGKYNYDIGLTYGEASGYSDMLDGYADTKKLIALLSSGQYNPFLLPGQTQSASTLAAIEDSKVRGRLFGGTTSVTQADASVSGELFALPGGMAGFATGVDLRREEYNFSGSQTYTCVATHTVANAALPNSVMGCPGNPSAPNTVRDIRAVYAEMRLPVLKSLEFQVAVRRDDYSQIGATTNPKVAFKWQPTDWFLARGSVNTGFRAPTAQQLNLGTIESPLTGTFTDPDRCPTDPTQCNRTGVLQRTGGNPTLKPEESKQGTFGIVMQPTREMQIYADYWQVELEDRIRLLSPSFMITNYPLFRDNFVRDASGNVQYIQGGWVNAAASESKGLDLGMRYSTRALGGRVSLSLNATKMISHKERLIATAPLQQLVGEWTAGTLYLPWKANGSVSYSANSWSTTLSFNYKDGYKDENMTPYSNNIPRRDVESYMTFGLGVGYTGFKNWTLRANVSNLLDKDPPFTYHNVDGVIGAGWDPRVANPNGRSVLLSVGYKF